MASTKIILRKKKNKDGTFPLAIRIIKNRKSSFMYIGHSIKESDWDEKNMRVKKSHPNSVRLNNLISKKVFEATDTMIDMEIQKKDTSTQAIKRQIKHEGIKSTFFPQAEAYMDNLKKSGKYNRVSAEQPRINRFKEFLNNEDIAFQEITVSLLARYQAYLKSTRTIVERTVVNHLVIIRSIFNQAIKSDDVDSKYYPFGKDKTRIKFPDSIKIGLTKEEVIILEELVLDLDSYFNHVRNLWLFSFYFAGMRISDVLRLRWSDFKDDRLFYSMGKNLKSGSLKVAEKALKILSNYKNDKKRDDDFIFPELKILENLNDTFEVQKKISNAVKRIDENLKKVGKQAKINKILTMHIARHTFGNISGDKISIQMLQKLYRHTSITTTISYQANFIHKDADDALDAVTNF
jgi:integrase